MEQRLSVLCACGYRFMRLTPWLMFVPGMAILLRRLAFNFVGDGVRGAVDRRQRSQARGATDT